MTVEHQSASRQTFVLLSLSLVIFLLLISVDSAPADLKQPLSNYIRTRIADENGIPTIVDNIVQSRDGFLWILVSGHQLARFDGRRFTPFDHPTAVRTLAVAPDGDLWVGTDHDLEQIPVAALNRSDPLPATVYHPGLRESSAITSLHFSRSGVLWVGTSGGLYRYEHGDFQSIIAGSQIERIEEASDGHLLVITLQRFVEVDDSRAMPHPELETQLGVKAAEIHHVFEDSRGVTWFCTAHGVARRIGGSIKKLAPWGPLGHGAFRVYEDPQGGMWFAKTEGLQVEGTPRDLNPMARDEAYRIATEALRNALRHAGARQIEVEIRYDEQQLRLRVRDDGRGIDPGVLEQGYAPGHWGLRGMRERAKLLGGNFEVWSEVGLGTEVEMTVPAASAYAKSASRWPILWRRWRK